MLHPNVTVVAPEECLVTHPVQQTVHPSEHGLLDVLPDVHVAATAQVNGYDGVLSLIGVV